MAIVESPPNIFRTYTQSKSQIDPERGVSCDLNDLLALFNLPDPELQLLESHLSYARLYLMCHIHFWLSMLKDSGKTTLFKFLIRLLDPAANEDVPFYDIQEFVQSLLIVGSV